MSASIEAGLGTYLQAMVDTFERHVGAEMTGDLETTMATMTDDPYVYHVPVMTGGTGYEGVRHFYSHHLIGKFFPPDAEIVPISRTIGADQLVEEGVVRFTHTSVIDALLPDVAPTGKSVEIAMVVIVKFDDQGQLMHEHIYWDQASVLVQLGLLDPAGLPVKGVECVQELVKLTNR